MMMNFIKEKEKGQSVFFCRIIIGGGVRF